MIQTFVSGIRVTLKCSRPLITTKGSVFKTRQQFAHWERQPHYPKVNLQKRSQECAYRSLHTTPRRAANPLLLLLLKTKGIKILKGLSIVLGRASRKLHGRLPEALQAQLTKHRIVFTALALGTPVVGYYSYTHYDTCPITARKRWITFTKEQVVALSTFDHEHLMTQYGEKLLDEKHPVYKRTMEIVQKLIVANSDIDFIRNTSWNLNFVDDASVTNAFVLPNGEIFVFTGMMKMLNTWDEMAVILGHEMSHAVLGHSQEQQSYLSFGELLTVPVLAFIWFYFDDFAAFLVYTIQQYLYPLIYEYGFSLPYSRLLETEADEVGLLLAAKACFDPRWSVLLWEKMAMKEALETDGSTEEFDFLATHPGNQKRSAMLEQKIPEVMDVRKVCNCPPLPSDTDPLLAAQTMRKCVGNIRERRAIMAELKQHSDIIEENSMIRTKPLTPEQSEKVAKIKNECETLSKRLQKLEAEYVLMIGASEPEPVTKRSDMEKTEGKERKGVGWIWGKVVGETAATGQLKFTLFDTEMSQLHTVNVKKSIFGKI